MLNVQKYLLAADSDKAKATGIAQDTAKGICGQPTRSSKTYESVALESKQSTLVDIVQSLSDYINDNDATVRSRTMQYLSQVIGHLHAAFLSRQQIQILCEFFCNRIEDGGAIEGLRRLATLEKFSRDMVGLTFRA